MTGSPSSRRPFRSCRGPTRNCRLAQNASFKLGIRPRVRAGDDPERRGRRELPRRLGQVARKNARGRGRQAARPPVAAARTSGCPESGVVCQPRLRRGTSGRRRWYDPARAVRHPEAKSSTEAEENAPVGRPGRSWPRSAHRPGPSQAGPRLDRSRRRASSPERRSRRIAEQGVGQLGRASVKGAPGGDTPRGIARAAQRPGRSCTSPD